MPPYLTFSDALTALKEGKKITRDGWHLKGMWLELQTPDEHSKMTMPYIFINIAAPDPLIKVPWTASQTDLLADDWYVTE